MNDKLMTDERVALVNLTGVELLTAGYKWPASTGDWTVTPEHLAAIVAASKDPGFRTPILKIGHIDSRFNGSEPFKLDGQPAFGRVGNVRLSEDKMTLLGDFIGLPAWLPDAMPSAYPSRSVEVLENVTSGTGRKHRMVLTAVALLGETAPAVQNLADVKSLYVLRESQSVYSNENAIQESQVPNRSSVNIDSVYHAFQEAQLGDGYWWIRDIWSDFVIADDERGGLWKVPWTIEDGKVTFDSPRKVIAEFVELTDEIPIAASEGPQLLERNIPKQVKEEQPSNVGTTNSTFMVTTVPTGTTFGPSLSDNNTFTTTNTAANVQIVPRSINDANQGDSESPPTDKESNVTPEALRSLIGLTDAADDEEVIDRLKELVATEETTPVAEEKIEDSEEIVQPQLELVPEPKAEPELVPEPIAASKIQVPEGFQLLDEATLAELKNAAAEGRAAREQQKVEHRERVLASAVQSGKFPPAQINTYRQRWERDPDLTEDLIQNHLASGTIPVSPMGHEEEAAEPDISQYLMFPELDASRRG